MTGPSLYTRRRFLQLAGVSAAAVVAGCTGSKEGASVVTSVPVSPTTATLPPLDVGDLPFAVWEEVRAAVRASPDHLVARAAEVVSSGDPEAIFAFVRDRISVVPPRPDGFARAATDRIGGFRAALRAGRGTPRERADLLADLYAQAGFEALVVEGDYTGPFDAAQVLAARGDLTFSPAADETLIRRWHDALLIEPSQPEEAEDQAATLQETARTLLDTLPATVGSPDPFSPAAPPRVAAVKVLVNGEEIIADPLLPDAVFGVHHLANPAQALTGPTAGDIGVRLEVSLASTPHLRSSLAQGTWPVEDVAGRHIIAGFLPTGDLAAALSMPPELVNTFTPFLGLDGPDLDPDAVAEAGIVGDTITLFGHVISTSASSDVPLVNGQPVGPADESGAAAVVTLEITSARPVGFPSISLRVAATSADGRPVADLPTVAFTVEDEGVAVPFLLSESKAPPPRVVLLFDTSRSLPAEFLDEQAAALAREVATGVLAARPDAVFKVAGVLFGTASLSPLWLSDPGEVETEANRVIGDGSEMWSSIADLRGDEASVIVLVSDAQATDPPEQEAASRHWVAAGPPVVVVGVGEYDSAKGEDIARTSGGAAYLSGGRAEAVGAVIGFLEGQEATPYSISYRAPKDGPDVRTVRVGCGNRTAEARYEVPPEGERVPASGLSGIYLTVTVQGRELTRTLAGVLAEDARIGLVPTPEIEEDIRSALFGSALLSVEVSPPTLGTWLDDFLGAKLSMRPLWEKKDAPLEEQVEAMGSGIKRVPALLGHLQSPLPAGTFQAGPRVVLLAERPVFGRGELWRADILPVPPAHTPDPDPGRAFSATLEATVSLSLLERDLFQDSTATRLAGRPLRHLAPLEPAPREGSLERWARLLDAHVPYHRLVPTDDGPFGFWVVDEQGSVLGILPDASGGGSSVDDIGTLCQKYSQLAAAAQLAGGGLGFPFAALISLGKTIAHKYLRAAAIVRTLESPEVPDECGPPGLGGLACDLAKDALGSWGKVGKLNYKHVDTADDVAEAAGAGGVVPCP